MGICKCKRITSLFCYECETHVCEDCILDGHERHYINTYTNWIHDSEHSGITCGVCNDSIQSNENFIRLTCLDTFHTACLDKYGSDKPATTALAGFCCPMCEVPMAPSTRNGGENTKLAQRVVSDLRQFSWIRDLLPQGGTTNTSLDKAVQNNGALGSQAKAKPPVAKKSIRSPRVHPLVSPSLVASRKASRGVKAGENLFTVDKSSDDEDKYKRRNFVSILELIGIASRKPGAPRSEPPKINNLRMFMLVLCFVLVTLIVVTAYLGPDLPDLPEALMRVNKDEGATEIQ